MNEGRIEKVQLITATLVDDDVSFSRKINEHLQDGWKIHGNMVVQGKDQKPAVMLVKYTALADWRDDGGPL